MMAKRQEHAEMTRKKLIDSRRKMIMQKGFENVSVEDITKDCGLAKGTFYTYFNSKEDLVQLINNNPFVKLEDEIAAMTDKTIMEQLSYYMINFMEYIEEGGIQMARQWTKNVIDPNAKNINNSFSKLEYDTGCLMEILNRAVDREQLAKDAPLDILTNFLINTLYGMMVCWCMSDGKFTPSRWTQSYFDTAVTKMIKPYLTE